MWNAKSKQRVRANEQLVPNWQILGPCDLVEFTFTRVIAISIIVEPRPSGQQTRQAYVRQTYMTIKMFGNTAKRLVFVNDAVQR